MGKRLLTNLILLIFASLLVRAAITDIRTFTISNKLTLSVALLYPIYLYSLYLQNLSPSIEYIAYSIGISVIIFFILVALFAFGLIGGGDVKLIPAVALWAGPSLTIKFLLITTICGGFVSLVIIISRYIKKYLLKGKSSEKINFYVAKSSEPDNGEKNIPYGIAISAGGLYVALMLFRALN